MNVHLPLDRSEGTILVARSIKSYEYKFPKPLSFSAFKSHVVDHPPQGAISITLSGLNLARFYKIEAKNS